MWTYYSFTARRLVCVFYVCLNMAISDTSGVFFAEVLSLEAQLSCCPQCWLSFVLAVQGCSSWVIGAAAHLPRSARNIRRWLLFLLRSSCASSRLVKVICHPAVQQSYGWTMLFAWFLSWLPCRFGNCGRIFASWEGFLCHICLFEE